MLATCPSENVLSGFALGQLPEDELDEVAQHVDVCTNCRDTLASGAIGDTLVAELRRQNGTEPFADEEAFARALASVRQPSFPQSEATGKPDECDQEPSAPDSLREYQLLDKLAQGGMGTVYRALHTRLQREVALKILPMARMQDAQAIHRFDREMQAVAKLDHPNIVRAYDAGEVDGTHFLVMELLEGTDLSTLIDRIGPLRTADACELVRQAAEGLAHAHRNGLVHRDVKPSNLMLCRDGVVKVLDLGLARLHGETGGRLVAEDTNSAGQQREDSLTVTDQLMGTPDYMAPEQASGGEGVDIRADIFSLGATLYKLLSGQTPYSGTSYNTLAKKLRGLKNDPVPPITAHRRNLSAGLRNVLDRMLAKDAKERFATPDDLIAALAPLCKGSDLNRLWTQFDAGIFAQPSGEAQHESATGERRRRITWKHLLLGATSAILLFAVLFVLRTPKGTLTVEVDESVSDRISVTARRGGEEVEITKKDEWRARLKEGRWTVELNQSGDQFKIEKYVVEIQSGKQAIVRIVREEAADASARLELAAKTRIELRVAVDPNSVFAENRPKLPDVPLPAPLTVPTETAIPERLDQTTPLDQTPPVEQTPPADQPPPTEPLPSDQTIPHATELQVQITGPTTPNLRTTTLGYRITVTNVGSAPAERVTVMNPIPPGMDFLRSEPTGQLLTLDGPRRIQWRVGTLAPGGSLTFDVFFRAVQRGRVNNVVYAQAANAAPVPVSDSWATDLSASGLRVVAGDPVPERVELKREMDGLTKEIGSRESVWVKLDPQLSGTGLVTEEREGELYALLSNKSEKVLVLDQKDIRLVTVGPDTEGRTNVWLKLNNASAGKLGRLTRDNLLKHLAIVVGGRIVMAPRIQSEVSREIQISGMFSKDEALQLARSLTGSQAAEFGAGQAQVFYQAGNGRTTGTDDPTTPNEQWSNEMLNLLKSMFSRFQPAEPAGPPQKIISLTPADSPIAESARWVGEELAVSAEEKATVRLFEIPITDQEQCILTYRFRIRTDELKASVYPEMWCRLPGQGEFFSRGLNQKVRGTNDWMSLEIPFHLKKGQRPELIKLNLVFEGAGAVRLKNVEVLATPLK